MKSQFIWLNDDLVPVEEARVSVNDRGFLYGDGLFETLRAEAGLVYFLKEHLDRLAASAAAFRLTFPGKLAWPERLGKLLAANGLEGRTARVKILLSRGLASGLGLPAEARPTLVIWAQPYAPPPPAEYRAGWPVAIFPERRSTFVGRHKSLNYLYYLAARQYALDQGAKEALILETDGRVSEGAATSLVYQNQGHYFTPAAASALPGVTVGALSRALARQSKIVQEVPTTLEQLRRAEGAWLANSLMGVMPVAAVEGQEIAIADNSAFLQDLLWAEARKSQC